MQAKAVVTLAPRQIEVQTISVPEPTPEDVVIRVTHSWISPGTEGSFIRGERINGETPRAPNDPRPFPLITGYQKVGVVEWIGAAVKQFSLGETVFATVSKVNGMHFATGGHVSPAVTHSSQVYALPGNNAAPPVAYSGLVLAQVGYNCGARPTIHTDDAAVVIGDGLVAHWAAQTLVHRGASVMMLGRHDTRLMRFRMRSQDRRVNTHSEDALTVARTWAPEGVQAMIDTVGSVADLEGFIPLMKHNGHMVSAGFHGTRGHMDLQHLRFGELTLHSPSGWDIDRMTATRDLIASGALQTEPLITHHYPVDQAVEAFAHILNRDADALGIILTW